MTKNTLARCDRRNSLALMFGIVVVSGGGCGVSSSEPDGLVPTDPRLDQWSTAEFYVGGPEWLASLEIQQEVEAAGSIVYFDDVIERMGSLPVSKPFDYMYGWKFTNLPDPKKPWLHHDYEMFYVVVRIEGEGELCDSIEEIRRLYWP